MVNEETMRAGELILLLRDDVDRQLFLRKVGTGQLEILSGLSILSGCLRNQIPTFPQR